MKKGKIVAYTGVLIALSTVLGKFLQIPIGDSIRISLENLPIILAGFMFGPIAGLATGVLADILGSLLRGYNIIPLITVAAGLIGLISGLLSKFVFKKRNYVFIFIIELISHLICSVVIKSLGLYLTYGTPMQVLWFRLPIYIGVAAIESVIIYALFKKKVLPL